MKNEKKKPKNIIAKMLIASMLGFSKSLGFVKHKDNEYNKQEIGSDK